MNLTRILVVALSLAVAPAFAQKPRVEKPATESAKKFEDKLRASKRKDADKRLQADAKKVEAAGKDFADKLFGGKKADKKKPQKKRRR